MPRKVSLRVLNVDLDDDATMERIELYLDDLLWSKIDGRVCVDIFVEETDLVCAAIDVACRISANIAGARVDQVDDELVGIPDIAGRTRLNRETIRSWSNGSRGPGNFPTSVGSIGGGRKGSAKVWRWRDVNRWLSSNFAIEDEFDYPSQDEVFEINCQLSRFEANARPALVNGPPANYNSCGPSFVAVAFNFPQTVAFNSIRPSQLPARGSSQILPPILEIL